MPRPPQFPTRERFSGEDRDEYDYTYNRVRNLTGGPPEVLPYVGACLVSPPFAASLWRLSGRLLAVGGTPDGTYSHKERIHINIVLGFDTMNSVMLGSHLAYAVEYAGLRPEMVRALWEGREEELLDDERQLVEYIRAFVDEKVTDAMWDGIVDRFGERGAVEYTLCIGYHLLCARAQKAFGVPSLSREEIQDQIDALDPDNPQNARAAGISRGLGSPELIAEMNAG